MAIVCDPTSTNNTHDIKLSDGTNELGFLLRSGNRADPRAINRRPRQNGQYSPFTQSDWGSGRGIKDAAQDRSRYADGKRVITRHNGTVMLGPQESYTTGYRQQEMHMPGKVNFATLVGATRHLARRIQASATGNRVAIYLWVKRVGTPTSTLTVQLMADNTVEPGSSLKSVGVTTSHIKDTVSVLYEFSFSSAQAVTASTHYWIQVGAVGGSDTAANCWRVGIDPDEEQQGTYVSATGDSSSWNQVNFGLYYRLVDDTDLLGGLFFQYRGQTYFVTRPSGSNAPKLYMNGDRGVANGSHSLTTLEDLSKSWTNDEWVGCTLLIVAGTNSEWNAAYRTITDNNGTTLTVSPPFPKSPVSADTQYVILGSNKWTEITGHGLTVLPTSICVLGDIVYFAQGDTVTMRRMREIISNGSYTRQFAEELNYAKFLIDFRHPQYGQMIGKVNDFDNSGLPSFAQARPESWGRRLKFPQLINDCEATTGWTAGSNVSITTDSTDFQTKTKSLKITVSGTPGNPAFYYKPASTLNLSGQKAIRFWIKATGVNVAKGDIKVFFSISATAASSIFTADLEVPELTLNEWQQVTIPYNDKVANISNVATIGFRVTGTTGSYFIDGIETVPNGSETPLGNPGEKITGLNRYGDPEVPWVFRTQSVGSVENGVFNPIPLRELSTAENIHNGMGNVVHNVYLYFSFLHGLERFYRNNLDDVGPNRDEGLPDTRRGYITSMQGYIGRFFYNYDSLDGYSAIFESTAGTDHHEIYRCDTPGKRIRNLFIQVIPGEQTDRLWFTEGEDILWLPLPGNTLKEDTDSTFRFTHEGILETGWITCGAPDSIKLFHSVKLFLEMEGGDDPAITWDYRMDADTTWTAGTGSFTKSGGPFQEKIINKAGMRLKLRFHILTDLNTSGPKIRAMVVEATTRPEPRYTYTMSTLLQDNPVDKQGQQDTSIKAEDVLKQLDEWVAGNTPLTMSSIYTPFHNKTVYLEPVVTTPLYHIPDASNEGLNATLTLTEPT